MILKLKVVLISIMIIISPILAVRNFIEGNYLFSIMMTSFWLLNIINWEALTHCPRKRLIKLIKEENDKDRAN